MFTRPDRHGLLYLSLVCLCLMIGTDAPGQTPLAFGYPHDDEIVSDETDSYVFDGTAGETIIVRMSEPIASGFQPRIELYGPDDALLAVDNSAITAEVMLSLDQTGTYRIDAFEHGHDAAGPYTVFVQRSRNPGNAVAAPYGAYLEQVIDGNGDVDTYTFDFAEAGARQVIVRMAEVELIDGFNARFIVFGPDGSQLAADYTGSSSGATAQQIFDASEAGTYTVWAMDRFGDGSGAYGVIVQQSRNPGQAVPAVHGAYTQNTISRFGDVHTYTFDIPDADPQQVIVRMAEVELVDGFNTWFRVFAPDGSEVAGDYTGSSSGATAQSIFDVNEAGSYTVWAMDRYGNHTGDYALMVQRSRDPGQAVPAVHGAYAEHTIASFGDVHTYTFEIPDTDPQQVIVRMAEVELVDGFNTWFRVFAPDGSEVAGDYTGSGSGATAQSIFDVNAAGSYTVWAMDRYGNHTGDYALLVQRSRDPGQAFPAVLGTYDEHTITRFGDVHTYTFEIPDADPQQVIVRMSETELVAGFNTWFRVFAPNGSEVASDYTGSSSGATASEVFGVSEAGAYTVWAMDRYGNHMGDYALMVQRSRDPGNATAIAQDAVVRDVLPDYGDVDTYSFSGTAGDEVTLRLSELFHPEIAPRLYLFRPDGQLLGSDYGAELASINETLPVSGDYSLWVLDRFGNDTGGYQLSFADVPVGVLDTPEPPPADYDLGQNFPNPFNPSTTIRYQLPEDGDVDLVVYDLAGRAVRRLLVGQPVEAGYHSVVWDGRNDRGGRVGSGIYLYEISVGDYRDSRRMMLVK